MLKLTTTDIKIQQAADDKQAAIRTLAADLTDKGLVDADYVEGMLNREAQNSTYLGNGIAIPHGTTDTRSLVKNTGVAVHHFPQGVNWGDGNTVYVAIGIAAKSDEHLGILKQLTKVLSDDEVEAKLQAATSKDQIAALLNGEVQFKADFSEELIRCRLPVGDMVEMSSIAGDMVQKTGAASQDFVTELLTKKPTNLGGGLWLISSKSGVSRTAMSFASAENEFNYDGKPVKALITLAACNAAHKRLLETLSQLVFEQRQGAIAQATPQELLAIFSADEEADENLVVGGNEAVFKIKNPHGLHARPGAVLVSQAKKFESTIKVSNLNGNGKQVNAKSLMKVIGLGVTQGHELKFVAEGPDAQEALVAIGDAINAGLGEG
ncbi:fused PTS fructose transporter subunit IIA/HPr protein [Thaumasiovibrio sp. DFM-14]|uniref:fused PTS fructose transporter subunit IIA/HPr protein n=1 Tax=Thaumasiovibrio sp. DFM-14 TaxID=3384792 RepID=UPI0039A36BC8